MRRGALYDRLVPEILSVRVIPGMDPSIFDYINANCRGVVIELRRRRHPVLRRQRL